MFWEVELRPHGKRKYFSSKDAALGAQIQPVCTEKDWKASSLLWTSELTPLAAMTVLADSGLSLTQAPRSTVEFHGIQTNPLFVRRCLRSERSEPIKSHGMQRALVILIFS